MLTKNDMDYVSERFEQDEASEGAEEEYTEDEDED